jgi:sec-independent protein translocase protein TatA
MNAMGIDLVTPTHLIFLALLALILFGPKRLPEIGRSLGTGIREFKGSVTNVSDTSAEPVQAHTVVTPEAGGDPASTAPVPPGSSA